MLKMKLKMNKNKQALHNGLQFQDVRCIGLQLK